MEEPPSEWAMSLNETAKTQYRVDHGGLYGAPALGSIVMISVEMRKRS